MAKKVIIMGAGIGGLAAAAQLAHKGFEVTVLEKQPTAGGKIIQLKKNGFTFDGGPSFITLSHIYKEFFQSVGKHMNDYITFKRMKESTTFTFGNHKTFTLYPSVQKVREEIEKKFPGDEKGFDAFMATAGKIYELLYQDPGYAKRNYHTFFGFDYIFRKDILSHLATLHVHESWEAIVNRYFKHPELRAVFSYQSTFLGMIPSEALGTYCFFPWLEITDGLYWVEGGTRGIAQGFVQLCQDLGVQFVYNADVKKLIYEGDQVKAVEVTNPDIIGANEIYEADLFVSNIDGAYFYLNLMPQEKNKTYTQEKIKKMKHTNSYFTINLGLKKEIPGLTHHTFFIPKGWHEFFHLILEPGAVKKLTADNLCYYLIQSSKFDASFAPKGKASVFILVPVPGYDPDMDWETYEQTFKETLYDIIEQRDNIPIRSLIETEIVYSPARWGKEFNLWENIILSFSLNFFQVNGFRMPNKSREFNNLYFCGGSTIPGPGIPPCITSGELVTQRILENHNP